MKMVSITALRGHFRRAVLPVLLALSARGFSQADESRSVPMLAEESPQWLVQAAQSDDFREPPQSPQIKSVPYSVLTAETLSTSTPIYHQPAGALSGKTVFAMAGHGWTYDSEEMYYYTQRGLSHGMVEDMGNADQMHIFAHMVFDAGATVFPFRPVDHQPNERVLDNTMPQVSFYGDWRAGSAAEFFGPNSSSEPYAVTSASLVESAVARYRPYIPEAGYYPVYVWARDGADRTNQTYRIAYAGGTAEIQVNWRRAGKSWAWLGTYYFERGTAGYVDVTNRVNDPYDAYQGRVTVADAIRFGNGRGDVPRPGGISGFSREDEGDCYWIERSLGNGANRNLFDIGKDGNSTVSSPPKAAAYVNREKEGSYLDRVLISFHSNASTGKARGAIGLFNARAGQRPTYQESLAEMTGSEINLQMVAMKSPGAEKWPERERSTYNGINFGELRRDYIQNEMCATIIETAFHDNPDDAKYLLDPLARMQMAEASLRGILKWYAEVAYPNSAFVMPPPRPAAIAAQVDKEGRIAVKWKGGVSGEYQGGDATKVRVYRSVNGYGFDGGLEFDAKSEVVTLDPATTSGVTFLRVTAANSAGESFPSQTVAVGIAHNKDRRIPADTVVIPLQNILDRSANAPYKLGSQPGGPYRETARTERVRPIYAMEEPAGAAEALALAAAGISFDGADSKAIDEDLLELGKFRRVFVAAGTQDSDQALFPEKMLTALRSVISKGGKICVTGSGFAANLRKQGGRNKAFLEDTLGITEETTAPAAISLKSLDDRFYPTTASLVLADSPYAWKDQLEVQPASFSGRRDRTLNLLSFENYPGSGALLTRPGYSEGEAISVGFPLGMLSRPEDRTALMLAILRQM